MNSFLTHILEKKLSLELHKKLNPKFWNDERELDPEVRSKLLEIAKVWSEYANIPKSAIKDIIFLGGNCNFNYTKYSDVDIHLVINTSKISDNKELLKDYYLTKKSMFSNEHNISIKGYPVEIFAQPLDEAPKKGQGVFSLKHNKWLQEPDVTYLTKYRMNQIGHKVTFYTALIKKVLRGESSLDDINKLKEKLRLMRSAGLEGGGEYSFENQVYKEIRNRGLLNKLNDYKKVKIDTKLSI